MTTPEETARGIVPCEEPEVCPFGWNGCRRTNACELRADVAQALTAARNEAVVTFCESILHGDDDHREWLRDAARLFGEGKPPPPPVGQGITERKIEAARNEALEEAANLLEQVVAPNDDSEVGERAADAFNDLDGEPMSRRLEAWNGVIATAIRALKGGGG